MLRTIRKLLGEKSNQIKFPIALMGADAVLSIVLYVVLYMTVIQLLSNTLTAGTDHTVRISQNRFALSV